jgi:biopolymer transport protein ExbD
MARHKSQQYPGFDLPGLDISSLIDVCFLLLIYFLVTSTITPRESDLGLALPGDPDGRQAPEIEPLYIQIEAGGQIYSGVDAGRQVMDSDPASRDLPLLGSHLEMYAGAARAANSTPVVKIEASDEATQQRVIDVLNALAAVNIRSVTFTDSLVLR